MYSPSEPTFRPAMTSACTDGASYCKHPAGKRVARSAAGEQVLDLGFTLAVAAGDLGGAVVGGALEAMPSGGHLELVGGELGERVAQFRVGVRGQVGQADVGEQLLDPAPVAIGARRLDVDVPSAARGWSGLGQDLGQPTDHGRVGSGAV